MNPAPFFLFPAPFFPRLSKLFFAWQETPSQHRPAGPPDAGNAYRITPSASHNRPAAISAQSIPVSVTRAAVNPAFALLARLRKTHVRNTVQPMQTHAGFRWRRRDLPSKGSRLVYCWYSSNRNSACVARTEKPARFQRIKRPNAASGKTFSRWC